MNKKTEQVEEYIEILKNDKRRYWECELTIINTGEGSKYSFEFTAPVNDEYSIYNSNNEIISYHKEKVSLYCKDELDIESLIVIYDKEHNMIKKEPRMITTSEIQNMSKHAGKIMKNIMSNLNEQIEIINKENLNNES